VYRDEQDDVVEVSVLDQVKRSKVISLARESLRPIYRRIRPYASLNSLDRKIEKYLPRNGVFIEAGANDGLNQSNTLFLARRYGWTGILIEPVPRLHARCVKNRKDSLCVNAALVSPVESGKTIELIDVDLMTQVKLSRSFKASEESLKAAEKVQGIKRREISITGRTLSEIIEDSPFQTIDLLSLDVEGFEMEVLQGITIESHFPKWILIETSNVDGVLGVLGSRYERIQKLSEHDYLLRLLTGN
jgi:FkbM family methyltransferase